MSAPCFHCTIITIHPFPVSRIYCRFGCPHRYHIRGGSVGPDFSGPASPSICFTRFLIQLLSVSGIHSSHLPTVHSCPLSCECDTLSGIITFRISNLSLVRFCPCLHFQSRSVNAQSFLNDLIYKDDMECMLRKADSVKMSTCCVQNCG